MAMRLQPCDRCPNFTYNQARVGGAVLCDPCSDTERFGHLLTDQTQPGRTH